ncbi:two-component system regulatory protein YycI [Thermoactinomyces intermedius]|jgi:regulatory protein YycI of two-component signal transduction system YycFG|uniref:Two-component system regulatory protein YycI n=1 Tax=Thermoactinomyces intermedius TaxID=2024 RepID=A0A8I1DBZ2_THEIN|nr:two-component system regulatory protein YycI [Thermoactinomyces intermedius]MBA4548069.1 two-component system regulatory protein YycI [Thermoactinomyces intermedius]MBA4835702.1 two-component system regulatory protein YycI [Thermoactinomyces intermedius]MBH8594913.1 two-component system regulatory protein YycI [Thermoactinomyces intermedius]
MDWSRAKSILIATFFILDLFLGLQLSQMMQTQSKIIREDQINRKQIDQLLDQVHVNARLDQLEKKDYPGQLTVYKAMISELGNPWVKEKQGSYIQTFSPGLPFQNEQDLTRILNQQIPFFQDFRYFKAFSSDKKRVYVQVVDQIPLFNGKVEVHLNGKQIEAIRVLHFNHLEKLSSVSAVNLRTALYRLITNWEFNNNTTINDANIAYRSKLYNSVNNEHILLPYWYFEVGSDYLLIQANNRGQNEGVEKIPIKQGNE